jgi:two-component system sensor histidine kinase YesM
MIKDYLSIQQVRFADRFCIHIDIHPDTSGCLLPKMLLQPLVENAIQHGIELRERDGELLISSTIEQDELVITVKDNGVGMDAEALAQLKQELWQQEGPNSNKSNNSVKIGVVNVHGRIQRYYGVRYGLEISSEPGEGFETRSTTVRRSDHV